jgi:hypothetical protein
MCLIVQRPAGLIIPKEKFDSSVIVNSDGWGFSAQREGEELTTIKSVDKDYDYDTLYDMLHDEFKDDNILLHLRFTTAGDTALRNAHPFPILEKEADGIDIRMAHNGTLYKYKPNATGDNSWESDTRCFVREFVRPLFKQNKNPKEILGDPFIWGLLNEQLTAASVLSFIDGDGNMVNCNEEGNGGSWIEGIYYSNVYSFDADHRKPKSNVHAWTGQGMGYGGQQYQNNHRNRSTHFKNDTNATQYRGSLETQLIKEHSMTIHQDKFTTKYKLEGMEDVYSMSDAAFDMLKKDEPDDLVMLSKELIAKCQLLEAKIARQEKHIETVKVKEKADANDEQAA